MTRTSVGVLVLAAACGRDVPLPVGDAQVAVAAHALQGLWQVDHPTAARCHASTEWVSFGTDGTMLRARGRLVDGADGACSEAVEEWPGRWSAGPGRRVLVDGPDGRSEFSATVARFAPRVRAASRFEVVPLGGGARPALTMRAFERTGADTFVDERRAMTQTGTRWSRTTVRVTPPLQPGEQTEACSFEVTVEVDVDGARAQERFTPPCRRRRAAETRFVAVGHLERLQARADAVFATGARERLPQPVVDALIDGLVLGLVLDEDEPGVGLAPAVFDGSWLEEARRSIPPMGR